MLFARFGFTKVSVTDIAQKAGVSKVTVYNLFGGKSELMYDCLAVTSREYLAALDQIMNSDKPYLERMKDVIRRAIEMNEAHPEFEELAASGDTRLQQSISLMSEQYKARFLAFVKDGKKQGYLDPGLSGEAIEAYVAVIFRGSTTDLRLHTRIHRDPRVFHDFLLIAMRGLSRTDGPSSEPAVGNQRIDGHPQPE